MTHRHSVLGEATDAGFLGGTAVAALFFLRDLLMGKPLLTPSVLGQVVLFGKTSPEIGTIDFGAVILYTAVHFLAFLAVGFLATILVRIAARRPFMLIGLLILFVIFEVAFYVMISAVEQLAHLFPIVWVLGANLLAAVVMGAYLWRRYPELKRALKREPLGA